MPVWNPLAKARQWWTVSPAPSAARVPYELRCGCGRTVSGTRQNKFQIVPCGCCGRKWFILPLSPLAPAAGEGEHAVRVASPPVVRAQRFGGRFRWAMTALLLLAAAAGLAAVVHFRVASPQGARPNSLPDVVASIRAHVTAGRQSLREGNFQLAADELEAAVNLRDQYVGCLPATESRELSDLCRQVVLLANLLTESLEEILRRLGGQAEREQQALFSRRYAGRAVVFDAQVWRDATGRYHLDYSLCDGILLARVEIQDLQLLHDLPLQDPQRLLFGARLAGIQREAAGNWMVRFEPASGVLLTDAEAVAASSAPPLDDDLAEVVRRQEAWMADRP